MPNALVLFLRSSMGAVVDDPLFRGTLDPKIPRTSWHWEPVSLRVEVAVSGEESSQVLTMRPLSYGEKIEKVDGWLVIDYARRMH
jgi:hypothetical protein